jgi:hypothetical protein
MPLLYGLVLSLALTYAPIDAIERSQIVSPHVGVYSGGASSGPGLLLIGDSHARYWVDALEDLATRKGWRFRSVVVPGCPWARVDSMDVSGRKIAPCDKRLRDRALREAADFNPEVTVLVSQSVVQRSVLVRGAPQAPGSREWVRAVSKGSSTFIRELKPHTDEIVVVNPIPRTTTPMVDCLRRGSRNCDQDPVYPSGTPELERIYSRIGGNVDISALICPDVCPAMVEGTVTYRDSQHLAMDYTFLIADEVGVLLGIR